MPIHHPDQNVTFNATCMMREPRAPPAGPSKLPPNPNLLNKDGDFPLRLIDANVTPRPAPASVTPTAQ
jgi:hypothetical protein